MSSQEVSGTTAQRRTQLYQRVPEEEAQEKEEAVIVDALRLDGAMDHTNKDDSEDDNETNSLVSSDVEGIFRSPAWSDSTDVEETVGTTTATTVSTGAGSSHRAGNVSSPAMHLMLSRSRSSHESDLGDSDWDDDDEAGIRRYHLDVAARTDIPLPAEFSHETLPKRVWQSFLELRTAARQRRAARLLTMPSQSWRYQLHACLLTSCCDATDLGILLAAAWLSLWIVIGLVAGMGSRWWSIGAVLFIFRVSARRCIEFLQAKRRRRRQRLASIEAVELGSSTVFRDKTSDRKGSFQEVL